MTIEELKNSIETKTISNKPIIFVRSEDNFLVAQYINSIRTILGIDVTHIDDLSALLINSSNIFAMSDDNLKIYTVPKFESTDDRLLSVTNVIIVCNDITDESKNMFSSIIVEVPKLEHWQLKDYTYSMLEGADESDLDELLEVCKYDSFRVQHEVEKLSIFDSQQRKYLLKDFIADGIFSDLSKYNIFTLTNAITKRDRKTIGLVLSEIYNCDVEPMGLLTTLINNFKHIIDIQLSNNPTPESCGLKPNQFWALKHSCGYYNREQLINIYNFLLGIDKEIKIGNMPMELLIDYVITYIMGV